jgi:NADH:ubiquinone oxidoreductase subunit K
MLTIGLSHYLVLSAIVFAIGLYGALGKRNAVVILMSIELMFNAVNVAFVAVGRYQPSPPGGPFNLGGQVFALFVITVAAAEAAVALAIILAIYRTRKTVSIDDLNLMKW